MYKSKLIELMLSSEVLTFGDFTTKSGRRTPYFINTGNYKTGEQLFKLGELYADTIVASGERIEVLFGPAYKGIPLCAAAASVLWNKYGVTVGYCFNRKEVKDHGEGGLLIGSVPKSGDRVAVIEDVTTAGTSIRETAALFDKLGIDAKLTSLFISADRMERGQSDISALDELRSSMNINVYPIVTVLDIIEHIRGSEFDAFIPKIEAYLAEYGA